MLGFMNFWLNWLDFVVAVWMLSDVKPAHPAFIMIHWRAVQNRSVEPDHDSAAVGAVHHIDSNWFELS